MNTYLRLRIWLLDRAIRRERKRRACFVQTMHDMLWKRNRFAWELDRAPSARMHRGL